MTIIQSDLIRFLATILLTAAPSILAGLWWLERRMKKVRAELEADIDRLNRRIDTLRAELKDDIDRVESKLDEAYWQINIRPVGLSDRTSNIGRQVSTSIARVDCLDDDVQRPSSSATVG